MKGNIKGRTTVTAAGGAGIYGHVKCWLLIECGMYQVEEKQTLEKDDDESPSADGQ